jgi:hypothetical protein
MPPLRRRYRVVPAAAYLANFASSRAHMVGEDGGWNAAPPDYPCIVARDGATMNLHRFWDMELLEGGAAAGGVGGGTGGGEAGAGVGGAAAGGERYGRVVEEGELLGMFGGWS